MLLSGRCLSACYCLADGCLHAVNWQMSVFMLMAGISLSACCCLAYVCLQAMADDGMNAVNWHEISVCALHAQWKSVSLRSMSTVQ
jgi:hypothetical protein